MRRLRRLVRDLLFGGTRSLEAHEKALLDRVRLDLGQNDRAALEQQIASIERIQRHQGGRMVTFHFDRRAELPRLETTATDHCLAKVRFRSAGVGNSAYVMSHRGLLSSLEFAQRPHSTPDFVVEEVVLHTTDIEVAEEIDREEHDDDA